MYRKLIPILVSPETYNYSSSTGNLDPKYGTSIFTSSGRIIPGCPYVSWDGPDFDTLQNVTLVKDITPTPGREVIFAKLVDYIYTVKLSVKGTITNSPRLLRVDSGKNLAYEVYDINGDLASFSDNDCTRKIYGRSFPLILLSPDELDITMEISGIHIKPINDPWINGSHCLITKCKSISAYTNVYDKSSGSLTRVLSDKFKTFNEGLRYNYFLNSYKGCITNTLSSTEDPLPPPVTIIYNSTDTIVDFYARLAGLLLPPLGIIIRQYGNICNYAYWWMALTYEPPQDTKIVLTNRAGTEITHYASYIYFYQGGFIQVDLEVLVLFPSIDEGEDCDSIGHIAALVDYYSGDFLRKYDRDSHGNLKPATCYPNANSCNSLTYGERFDIDGKTKIVFKDTYIISVTSGQYIWYKLANLVPELPEPNQITGSLKLSYIVS